VWVEARAREPIVPLGLFRNRSFSISVTAVFLAAFGFFATVVFLPRWFQVVDGSSATISGYQMLPLLGGLIVSAVAAGQIVSRTGRYRLLLAGALAVMAVGLFMLTQLRADTPIPVLWAWMLVAGIGVGPTFAVFPLVVQNNVPIRQLGAATSNLTFFQQVGGTVGLAITGTVFATSMTRELPEQVRSAGVPTEVGAVLAGAPGGLDALTGVGDLGAALLASVSAELRPLVEPYVPAIVGAIHGAFSVATSSTFVVGIGASLLSAVLVLLLREATVEASATDVIAAAPSPGEADPLVERTPERSTVI
jgi:MFS family permease